MAALPRQSPPVGERPTVIASTPTSGRGDQSIKALAEHVAVILALLMTAAMATGLAFGFDLLVTMWLGH